MKKNIIIGIAAIALSLVLMIAFIIGGVSKIQTGPAAVVERFEKAINKGDLEKALACFGIQDSSLLSMYDMPYYGQSINLIPGEVQEIEGEVNRVKMQVGVVYQEGEEVEYEIDTLTFVKYDNRWIIEIF